MDVLQAAEEDDDPDAAEAGSDDGKRNLSLSLPHKSVRRAQASIKQLCWHQLSTSPVDHADLRTLENKPRRDGKRSQPSKLTTHQLQVIQRLIEAHGEDVEVCRCMPHPVMTNRTSIL